MCANVMKVDLYFYTHNFSIPLFQLRDIFEHSLSSIIAVEICLDSIIPNVFGVLLRDINFPFLSCVVIQQYNNCNVIIMYMFGIQLWII